MRTKSLLLAAAATLFLSTAARAQDMAGFYLGAFGGYGWTTVDRAGGPAIDANGDEWGVFAGYDFGAGITNRTKTTPTLAIEAYYTWSNADDTRVIGGVPVFVEKDHEWGISLRPGLFFLSDSMKFGTQPYGILGWRRAEFATSAAGVSAKEDLDGFELGVGTEFAAHRNFGLRLDYTHVFYEEEIGLDPDEDDLRLGAVFRF